MHRKRFSRLAATIVGLVLVTMLGVPAWGQPQNAGAGYQHFWISGVPVSTSSPTDSLKNDVSLTHQLRWDAVIDNNYDTALTNARIIVHTGLDPSCFAGGLPVGTSKPSLIAHSGLHLEINNTPLEGCSYLRTFQPGFDSSRTVSPLLIPPGVGHQQTLTITVTPIDVLRYPSPGSGIGILLHGRVLSYTCPPEATEGESCTPNPAPVFPADNPQVGLGNPKPGKTYTFTAVLQVDNPNGYSIYSKPDVAIIMSTPGPSATVSGVETTREDPLLGVDGGFTFAVDDSVTWSVGTQDNWNLIYGPVTEKVSDTTPPVISGLPTGCSLWPPNHKLVTVAMVNAFESETGSGLASLAVKGTSNEPDNGLGDGDTPNDIVITPVGPLGPYVVQLRAERSGTLTGRVYTITATAKDKAGNTDTQTAICTVPHNR